MKRRWIAGLLAAASMPVAAASVRVNVYASDESFARYGAVLPRAAAVVILGDVHLAPKMQSWPAERTEAIVTHELAHLHLVQRIGTAGIGKLPNWFWEGLPTYLSGGGGAGTVTREEAVHAFVNGRHMVPEDEGSLLAPKQAPSYGLAHAMYYRQFKRLLAAVGRGDGFASAVRGAYGRPLEALWAEFQQAMRAEILNKPSDSA